MILTPEKLNEQCTYATQEEIDFMRKTMAESLPDDAIIVMIGAGPGVLLFPLLEKENNWNFTVIDIESVQWAREHYKNGSQNVSNNAQRINWVEGRDSYEIGLEWLGDVIDLLIIDGDHTERGVKRDMEAWLPHVGYKGFVWFHDYQYTGTQWEDAGIEPVQPFVDPQMQDWNRVGIVGTSAIFQRKVK